MAFAVPTSSEATEYTAADVTRIVNIMAGKEPYAADADFNNDGKIDIADLIVLVNIIQSQPLEYKALEIMNINPADILPIIGQIEK